ncbi:MAG: potassium-transporting ATPase subunit KdpC [Desulfobacula sp.]
MKNIFFGSIRLFLALTVLLGVLYPVVATLVATTLFPHEAKGSLIHQKNIAVGSELISQPAKDASYFSPRPSAGDYGTVASGASNLAITSRALKDLMQTRASKWEKPVEDIPQDLLFSSGSGLDPHISPEAAYFQIPSIAQARGLSDPQIHLLEQLIADHIENPQWGIFGEPRVNVLLLNCRIDTIKELTPVIGN